MENIGLSYKDVALIPNYSTLKSRTLANTFVELGKKSFKLPIIPANMKSVINIQLAKYLSENNYFYILHRFFEKNEERNFYEIYDFIKTANNEKWKTISISIGVNSYHRMLIDLIKNSNLRIDFLTIDVAHSDHESVLELINYIRQNFVYEIFLIVGNVSTPTAVNKLYHAGANMVKVGIGSGGICTTYNKTGFFSPMFSTIKECSTRCPKVPIIADGGIKDNGDIIKALVAGASFVMTGGLFAACIDSPATIVNGKKQYFGSSSYEVKRKNSFIEGKLLEIDQGITYAEKLQEIKESIQSAISYAGGKDLSAFKDVKWQILK